MAKILVLPSEVVGELESGNSYAFPADNILMSDKTTTVEEAVNSKTGEKTDGGGEIFNNYENNIASGNYSHAEGSKTTASAIGSHAEGFQSIASGTYSHAEGGICKATGHQSHAEGQQTESSGRVSHAEGQQTVAAGEYSHAEGAATTASGDYSHSEGHNTIAASKAQHVQGQYNIEDADGVYAHIVGWGTGTSARANIHTITTTGDGWFAGKVSAGTTSVPAEPTEDNDLTTKKYVDESGVGKKTDSGGEIFNNATDANIDSHAEGVETTASGAMSHAEGNLTTASGASSHAEGSSSDAIGNYSHAEGRETEASGVASHAEGYQSNASGDYSHAEASGVASGDYSHAEGVSFATGNYSHAEGIGNTAYTEAQHVEGKYSELDSEGLYAHIIGWGASDEDRKNINTIDTNGNGWFAGTVEGANGIKVGPSIITYNEDNQMITFNFE